MKGKDELADMLTELDPPYESKEELQIGRMLDQYGIPFFYKQPTIVYDGKANEVHKPSFTIFSYGGTVIDYIAGSDEDRMHRQQLYRYNQIPAVVLGPKSLTGNNWQQSLYEKLQQASRQPADLTAYLVPPEK